MLVAREIADVGAPDYVREDLPDEWRATDPDLAADSRRTTWPHRSQLDMDGDRRPRPARIASGR